MLSDDVGRTWTWVVIEIHKLFFFNVSASFCSPSMIFSLTRVFPLLWSSFFQVVWSILVRFMYLLTKSLKQSCGHSTFWLPSFSSPYRSLRIQQSFILLTWPSQRRQRLHSKGECWACQSLLGLVCRLLYPATWCQESVEDSSERTLVCLSGVLLLPSSPSHRERCW